MFLRSHRRIKDGKEHRYYSIEESRRLQSGWVVQRRILYLGEIPRQPTSSLAEDAGGVRRAATRLYLAIPR
jgi:hypothetical protein